MNGAQYRAAIGVLGLSLTAAGRLFGVHGVSGQRWGRKGPPRSVELLLGVMLGLGLSAEEVEAMARRDWERAAMRDRVRRSGSEALDGEVPAGIGVPRKRLTKEELRREAEEAVARYQGSVTRIGHLSEEEIEAGRSPAGGFTRAQLAQWGIPWPPPKGWRKQLTGRR